MALGLARGLGAAVGAWAKVAPAACSILADCGAADVLGRCFGQSALPRGHLGRALHTAIGVDGAERLPWISTSRRHIHAQLQTSPAQPTSLVGLAAYQPIRILGRGCAGEVWLCRHRGTGQLHAVKLVERPLQPSMVEMLSNEIKIQAGVGGGHVGVCRLREVLLTPTHAALVMDYAAGGTVLSRLAARPAAHEAPRPEAACAVMPESTAQFMFRQLVSTVSFLHKNHIAHLDIKLENTLLDGGHPPRLWLADFQFAQPWGPAPVGRASVRLGTPAYMAPEVLANLYTDRHVNPALGDVWACGVWLSALLTGAMPYSCDPSLAQPEMARQILRQQLRRTWRESQFVRPHLPKLSPECVDLLDQMLHRSPKQRISTAGILEHPWVNRSLPSELAAAWEGLEAEQADRQTKLSKMSAEEAVTCDEHGNCSVLQLVQAAATAPGPSAASAPLMRIDCMRPEVAASLHSATVG